MLSGKVAAGGGDRWGRVPEGARRAVRGASESSRKDHHVCVDDGAVGHLQPVWSQSDRGRDHAHPAVAQGLAEPWESFAANTIRFGTSQGSHGCPQRERDKPGPRIG
jgi:hypothetical protein